MIKQVLRITHLFLWLSSMTKSPVKVLLVEDSPIALKVLQRLLQSSPDIAVVGTATNGKEALEIIPQVQPQVICTDLHMKGMDGLELTQQVMAKFAIPILVISNSVQKEDTSNTFKLLQAGAVDVFPKPRAGQASDYEQVKEKLIAKLKILSGVSVFTKPLKPSPVEETIPSFSPKSISPFPKHTSIRVVTIGASTGGPQALQNILSQLPSHFPVPVICTQHISSGFLQGLVDWLSSQCQLPVAIAQPGELLLPGKVYFAPEKSHLELNSQNRLIYVDQPLVDGHCPSITVMFKSVAQFYGSGTAAVLLTGMGKDGAAGMRAIAQAGGLTIAQDEKTCVVFGMPKEAIALGGAHHILPIQEIASLLVTKVVNSQSTVLPKSSSQGLRHQTGDSWSEFAI